MHAPSSTGQRRQANGHEALAVRTLSEIFRRRNPKRSGRAKAAMERGGTGAGGFTVRAVSGSGKGSVGC